MRGLTGGYSSLWASISMMAHSFAPHTVDRDRNTGVPCLLFSLFYFSHSQQHVCKCKVRSFWPFLPMKSVSSSSRQSTRMGQNCWDQNIWLPSKPFANRKCFVVLQICDGGGRRVQNTAPKKDFCANPQSMPGWIGLSFHSDALCLPNASFFLCSIAVVWGSAKVPKSALWNKLDWEERRHSLPLSCQFGWTKWL